MMKRICQLGLLGFLVAFSACKTTHQDEKSAGISGPVSVGAASLSSNSKEPLLTSDQAANRAKRIQNVAYKIHLKMQPHQTSYLGEVELNFNQMGDAKEPLRVDFQRGKILSLTQDSNPVIFTKDKDGIYLPTTSLKKGDNHFKIEFTQDYSDDGSGFMRVVDPEDKAEYFYTNLETYGASRVVPCFDQPDLKAKFSLLIETPSEWEVVSTTRESEVINLSPVNRVWTFPESAPISTYVWSVHVGPYKVWEDHSGKIPLRLFARQTLAKFVRSEDWFRYTQAGLKFYENFFQTKYPFKKYDQILVPEFASGAMENVAAVTFNERYIRRSTPTIRDQRNLADTLLHEMAHMWFGDLVTMRWWNGLWLNESFATYMSSLAMLELPEFKNYARVFHGEKNWAYRSDQLVTTHPIEVPVRDTLESESIFDGISYGKGAAVLKQLHFLVGNDAFVKGLHHYFKKHAFSNSELSDFIASIASASGRDLSRWKKDWLESSGTSLIRPSYTCAQGKITALTIHQSAAKGEQPLRQHRFRIATFYEEGGKEKRVVQGRSFTTEISGAESSVKAAIGTLCPAAIYPNQGDYGFFQVDLDATSRAFFVGSFGKIPDVFLRQLVLSEFFRMVNSGNLSPSELYALVSNESLWSEKDDVILGSFFAALSGRRPFNFLDLFRMAGIKGKSDLQALSETHLWNRLSAQELKGDDLKLWWDTFVGVMESDSAVSQALAVLKRTEKIRGLDLDPDRHWAVIRRLAILGRPEASTYLEEMKKSDLSKFGVDQALVVDAAGPVLLKKQLYISEALNEHSKYSNSQFKGIFRSLFPTYQRSLLGQYRSQFFRDFKTITRTKSGDWSDLFSNLVPIDCTEASLSELRQFSEERVPLSPQAEKRVKVAIQENEECLKFVNSN